MGERCATQGAQEAEAGVQDMMATGDTYLRSILRVGPAFGRDKMTRMIPQQAPLSQLKMPMKGIMQQPKPRGT